MPTVTNPPILDSTGQAIATALANVSIRPQIVDNCTTADANKALSANQGKVLNDYATGIKPSLGMANNSTNSLQNTSDANSVTKTCVLYTSNASNLPSGVSSKYGYLITIVAANSLIKQIYTPYDSLTTYERLKIEGTWGAWTSSLSYLCIGSQVLYDHYELDSVTKQNLIGAPDDALFAGISENFPIPVGYHKEYRLTCQATTTSSNYVSVGINNISVTAVCTWSANTYKFLTASPFFKYSDIVFEPVLNYPSQTGCNLWINNDAGGIGRVYYVTLHAFLVKDY